MLVEKSKYTQYIFIHICGVKYCASLQRHKVKNTFGCLSYGEVMRFLKQIQSFYILELTPQSLIKTRNKTLLVQEKCVESHLGTFRCNL